MGVGIVNHIVGRGSHGFQTMAFNFGCFLGQKKTWDTNCTSSNKNAFAHSYILYNIAPSAGMPTCFLVWYGMVWYGKFGVSAFKHLGKVRCSSLSRSGFALTLQPPGLAQPVRVPTAKSLRAYALAREKSLSYHDISVLSIIHKNLILTLPRLYLSCACIFSFTATA